MLTALYMAIARHLAATLATDPALRVLLIQEITRLLLTDDTPVTLTDEEKAAILAVKAELEATG